MSDIISDAVAESLENSALWRRAATRWLEVMWCCQTDEEREWINRRRSYCYSKITPVLRTKPAGIRDVSRAASLALENMGIKQPDGSAFRSHPDRLARKLQR